MSLKSCLAVVLLVVAAQASAAEVKVLSTDALTDVIGEVMPQFESRSGHKVTIEFKPTNVLAGRIRGGEPVDLLILGRQAVLNLEKDGRLVAGSRADVAQSSVALAIRVGASKPDISTVDAFKKAMLAANSVAVSRVGLSGQHLMKVLEQLGIAEAMKPKLRLIPGGRTAELIAKGEAEMAVQLVSELKPVAGVEVVGPFPKGIDNTVVLTGAVYAGAKEPAAAQAFLAFMLQPTMVPVLKRHGMERPGGH